MAFLGCIAQHRNQNFLLRWKFDISQACSHRFEDFSDCYSQANSLFVAAHCIHNKYTERFLTADEIVILLGRYDLSSNVERGSTQREVTDCIVNPEWKINTEKWDADLAMLVLETAVEFTEFIQPICLPAEDVEKYADGFVVRKLYFMMSFKLYLNYLFPGWMGKIRI